MKDYEKYRVALGLKIRRLRREKGMNQKLFGAEVGIDERQLRKIEKGLTNPRLNTLYSISNTLGLELDDLFSL